MRWYGWVLVCALGSSFWTGAMFATAQETAAGMGTDATASPATMESALRALSGEAAVIFLGSVTAVRRAGDDPASASAGVVEIDFSIDTAVRGCQPGATYTLREWAGRWAGNDVRYRIGQRFLMLLQTPNAAGLSSPVRGSAGAIPVRGGGGTVGEHDSVSSAREAVADLRWIGAKLARPVVYRKEAPRGWLPRNTGTDVGLSPTPADTAPGALSRLQDSSVASQLVGAEAAAAAANTDVPAQASVAAQEASLSATLALMGVSAGVHQ